MIDMKNPTVPVEDVTRAVELISRYKPAPGCPTATLLFSSVNMRPTLSFYYGPYYGREPHMVYFEDNPYYEVNGYDSTARGRFIEGLTFLEVLVNAQP